MQGKTAIYKCAYGCEKVFIYLGSYICHVKKCLPSRKENLAIRCAICNLEFQKPAAFTQHLESHYENQRRCSFCALDCKSAERLDIHMRIHTGEKPYECKQCNYWFISAYSLGRHVKLIHQGKRSKCRYCKYRSLFFHDLKEHEDKHSKKNSFGCQPWNDGFATPSSFGCEIKIEHQDQDQQKSFSSQTDELRCMLKQEKSESDLPNQETIGVEERLLKCEQNNLGTNWEESSYENYANSEVDLKEHIATDIKPLLANMEVYSSVSKLSITHFNQDSNATQERKMCVNQLRKTLVCKLCDYRAYRLDHLESHQTTHRNGILYVCKFCGYRASTQLYLTLHKKKEHKTIKQIQTVTIHPPFSGSNYFRYSCKLCDFVCQTVNESLIHSTKHKKLVVFVKRLKIIVA